MVTCPSPGRWKVVISVELMTEHRVTHLYLEAPCVISGCPRSRFNTYTGLMMYSPHSFFHLAGPQRRVPRPYSAPTGDNVYQYAVGGPLPPDDTRAASILDGCVVMDMFRTPSPETFQRPRSGQQIGGHDSPFAFVHSDEGLQGPSDSPLLPTDRATTLASARRPPERAARRGRLVRRGCVRPGHMIRNDGKQKEHGNIKQTEHVVG